MAAVDALRLSNAKEIIVVDVNVERLEMAKEWGATMVLNPHDYKKPIQEVIVDITEGVDYSFECTGNVNVMRSALECCHKG